MDRTKLRQWAFATHWRACAVMAQNQVVSSGSGSPEKDAATVGRDRALTTLPVGQSPPPQPQVAVVYRERTEVCFPSLR